MNPEVTYAPRENIVRATQEHPTPFFIYEEERLRQNCRTLKNAFEKYFPKFYPLYAVKANTNPEILRIIHEEGYDFDCSSQVEVWIANQLGVGGMHTGNYTSEEEMRMVLEDSQLILNLDDISMLPTVERIGVPETLSFRINPKMTKGSMESLLTAGPEAKFGVPLEQAVEAYRRAQDMGVKRFGIHMMTGSNILDEEYFKMVTQSLFELLAQIRDELDIEMEFLNVGGGFGVPYEPDEESLDLDNLARLLREAFDEQCTAYQLQEPTLMVEPGRYITANAGWLVGRVQVIKDSYKKFIGIDASSNDMPRPAIYDAYHYASVINDATEKEEVTIVGSICENNDQFAKDRMLPRVAVGDIVVIHTSGGHAFAMGTNYNGTLRHAEYLIRKNGKIEQIRRAETIEDFFNTVQV